jgi:hypothetical protein
MTGILMMAVGNSYGSAPVNTVAPAVTGTATFGQTLTTTNGTWLGAPAPTFTYQCFRSPSTSISGATSSTYVLVQADVGSGIFCQVRATNSVAPSGVTANSNTTATVIALVPGAPTIGTATATGSSTATVAYTAPASNGGATITVYTATSSPGGITGTLSQAGSGTITVSGLSPSTSYTFTVTATNSVGTSAASGSSNSITTSAVTGQATFTTPGIFTWVVPTGVTSVSAVSVGGGGGGTFWNGPSGGAGGGLGYKNNASVTGGNTYNVYVGAGGSGGYTNSAGFGGSSHLRLCGTGSDLVYAYGGNAMRTQYQSTVTGGSPSCLMTGGGTGGNSGHERGGGGAGGYGGTTGSGVRCNDGSSGNGVCGGGGGGKGGTTYGGGVGILGQGANGSGTSTTGVSGTPGSGGSGATYGGGGAGGSCGGFAGGGGVVRVIYPGSSRSYPSTNTGDL